MDVENFYNVMEEAQPTMGQIENFLIGTGDEGVECVPIEIENRELIEKRARRIHNRSHRPGQEIAKMMQGSGLKFSEELIQAVRDYFCPLCANLKKSISRTLIGTVRARHFNLRIQVDILTLHRTIKGRKRTLNILAFIDEFLPLMIFALLSAPTPESFFNAYVCEWVSLFGPSRVVVCDEQTGLVASDSGAAFSECPSRLEPVPRDSHNKLGKRDGQYNMQSGVYYPFSPLEIL